MLAERPYYDRNKGLDKKVSGYSIPDKIVYISETVPVYYFLDV